MRLTTLILIGATLMLLAGCAGPKHFLESGRDGVTFYLKKPNAENVLFASSLDGYEPHETTRTPHGEWTITVQDGQEFSYFYIVDGTVATPDCSLKESDDFGSFNCIYSPHM